MVKTKLFRKELNIPEDVSVKLEEGPQVVVDGPNGGPITKDFSHIKGFNIKKEGKKLVFEAYFPRSSTISLANTIINILQNLIEGVQTNYKYVSKVCYSHFPCSVEAKPNKEEIHVINFLGERAPRVINYDPELVDVEVEGDDVYLSGSDKEVLGQTAANLKKICHIRKKDPRIYQDGVYLYKILHGDEVLWQIR